MPELHRPRPHRGTLERKTFPGPPQYESIAAGDEPETVWLLKLDAPVCVSADPNDPSGINAAASSVGAVQLILDRFAVPHL